MGVEVWDSIVLGAGQAGLSTSYHLRRRGVPHVVLDADEQPGGAWQHRWDSLTMADVHGVAALPDADPPAADAETPANVAVPAYFAAYERDHDLPVLRPVRVEQVHDSGPPEELLVVESGDRSWTTRTLVNATGTWSRPFVPHYPGLASFRGEQVHTHDYPGADAIADRRERVASGGTLPRVRGRRTLVVGGGTSAVQHLGELAPVTDTLWVTRRPPVWRTAEFTPELGREVVAVVEDRVRRGLPPGSVSSATGLGLREQERAAAERGAYRARPMFEAVEPDGVRWADGTFEPVEVILWATGFRPAVSHLAPLGLRTPEGGIRLDGTTAVADPRVQLVGYGPSASTIGANRAGRVAARAVSLRLGRGAARSRRSRAA